MSKAIPPKRRKAQAEKVTLLDFIERFDTLKGELFMLKDKVSRLERRLDNLEAVPSNVLIGSSR